TTQFRWASDPSLVRGCETLILASSSNRQLGGWHPFSLGCFSHFADCGCPVLAFFARAGKMLPTLRDSAQALKRTSWEFHTARVHSCPKCRREMRFSVFPFKECIGVCIRRTRASAAPQTKSPLLATSARNGALIFLKALPLLYTLPLRRTLYQ